MDKQLVRDFVTTRPALHNFFQEVLLPERRTIHGKERPVPAIPKAYQIVKTINIMKKLHQLMGKTTN